jgi:NADH:ubiquinone oxidoreductase subunit F (NADH-binding)
MDRVVPEVVEVPRGYVVGEESALINYLNTGAALPTYGASHPSERGVAGRPTLVQNLETLAHLALIARHGPEWFRELGTDDDPGSALIDITGAVASPGLYEIPAGLPLGALVEMAGGQSVPLQAFLVGGYAGTWTASEQALELSLGHAALRKRGGTLGPGMVAALPRSSCGVQETARIARFLADASSGQCGPCMFGLPAIADGLQAIVEGLAEPGAHSWVEYWSQLVGGRGACHHPDGAAQMVASGLRVFADDLTRHETGDSCLAAAFDRGAGIR